MQRRVFLAEETRLGRHVVIKVLPPETGARVSVGRFEREIQFAAQLQHSHIVPLLSAGAAGDLLYYVMAGVELTSGDAGHPIRPWGLHCSHPAAIHSPAAPHCSFLLTAQRAAPLRFLTLLSLVYSIHAQAPAPVQAQAREMALPALLPAEIAGNSTLLLPVGVNGSAARWFILDTGANSCVMDEAAARALRLAFEGAGEARGAGRGTVPYRIIATPIRFTTHGVPFTCERVIALDLSGQRSIFGRPIDGILGHDFFARFVTELDWDAQVVRVHDTAAYEAPAGAPPIPLRFERRVPYLEATLTVEGHPPERRTLLLDTGSEDAVDDSLVLKSSGPKRTVTGGVGLGQTYEVTLGRIDRVELGPFELRNVLSVAPGVALVGSGALQKFFFAVDYSRGRLYLEPDPRYFPETSHSLVGSGATLRADSAGGVRVHEVLPETPAAEAGIRAGDRIDRLDGARAERLGHVRVQKLLDRPGRTYVLLVRRDGAEVRIRLRT